MVMVKISDRHVIPQIKLCTSKIEGRNVDMKPEYVWLSSKLNLIT